MGLVPILHGAVDATGRLRLDDHEQERRQAHFTRLAGQRVEVIVRKVPTPRTRRQNNYMHVLLDILGRHLDLEGWTPGDLKHELLGACFGWRKTAEGHDIPVHPYTSELSKDDMTLFLDFVLAWGAQRGVVWPDPDQWEVG